MLVNCQTCNYETAMNWQPLWDINNGQTLCLDCHKKTYIQKNMGNLNNVK